MLTPRDAAFILACMGALSTGSQAGSIFKSKEAVLKNSTVAPMAPPLEKDTIPFAPTTTNNNSNSGIPQPTGSLPTSPLKGVPYPLLPEKPLPPRDNSVPSPQNWIEQPQPSTREERLNLGCGYVFQEESWHPFSGKHLFEAHYKSRDFPQCKVYSTPIQEIKVLADIQSPDRLSVKILDKKDKRWKVPEDILPRTKVEKNINREKANFAIQSPRSESFFGLKVFRKQGDDTLFSTEGSELIFEDEYLEISTAIPEKAKIYGFGEIVDTFERDAKNTTQVLFTREAIANSKENLYGSHPFHMQVLPGGRAHGILLISSNPMEIKMEKGFITYRVLGGILEFLIFNGPTPHDVIKQYSEAIGRPSLPPYWSLGFHQGGAYRSLLDIKNVIKQYEVNGIPLETVWGDLDLMNEGKTIKNEKTRYPFKEIAAFTKELHAKKQHFVINVPQYKPYRDGKKNGIFLKTKRGDLLESIYPREMYFPDWFNSKTQGWWNSFIKSIFKSTGIDGIAINTNEAAKFDSCTAGACRKSMNMSAQPTYRLNNGGTFSSLSDNTLPLDTVHKNGATELNVHNLYGHMEGVATRKAVLNVNNKKRPFVLSLSTFPGSGKTVAHSLGTNPATWEHMRNSIPGILNFQMFGIPFTGADICGSYGNVDIELCTRWMQLGALYPFARNQNGHTFESHEAFRWASVGEISRLALNRRYSLLPYMYTQLYSASISGTPFWRPLFFEFMNDQTAATIEDQFMVGPALLASPVLTPGATQVNAYFPVGTWYDFETGAKITSFGQRIPLDAPIQTLPLHIRGGQIIALQDPAPTTTAAKQNPFTLVVALDSNQEAKGQLYLDDGENIKSSQSIIEFKVKNGVLSATGKFGYTVPKTAILSTVKIYGVGQVGKVTYSRDYLVFKVIDEVIKERVYKKREGYLGLTQLNLSLNKGFEIKF